MVNATFLGKPVPMPGAFVRCPRHRPDITLVVHIREHTTTVMIAQENKAIRRKDIRPQT